jgi:hypothetical protein
MMLFGEGSGEALKRFFVDDGAGHRALLEGGRDLDRMVQELLELGSAAPASSGT